MKRLFLILVSLLAFFDTYAGNSPIVLKSGNASAMKSAGTAVVEFDFSSAKVINGKETMSWEQFLQSKGDKKEKWEKQVSSSIIIFAKQLSKKTKPMKVVTEGTGDFRLIVQIAELDLGDTGAALLSHLSVFGGSKTGGAQLSGEIRLIDSDENELCSFSVNDLKGLKSEGALPRYTLVIMELAKQLAKLLK